MTEYREKIKQAEANASMIVEKLKILQNETVALSSSKEVVNKVSQQLNVLVQSIQSLAIEQQNYINKLNEIDVAGILQKTDSLSSKVKNLKNILIIGIGVTILLNLIISSILLFK